jgi:hypothetical protein
MSARLQPFIEDMAAAYGWADLVICRAGALTVSELAAAGVGAILVPFAAATDDHQTRNAAILVDDGAAVMIAERELSSNGWRRNCCACAAAAAGCWPWPSAPARWPSRARRRTWPTPVSNWPAAGVGGVA